MIYDLNQVDILVLYKFQLLSANTSSITSRSLLTT